MTKPICIYHGNCADGFTSAWAVWRALGDQCDYHPGIYQDPPPAVSGRGVIMVDFSYKRAVTEEMRRSAAWVKILDHHKSAIDDLRGIEEREGACPIELIFDIDRSGAGIAWDVYHHTPRPALVNYVEDRDLWRFKLPSSREINAAIFSYEYSFQNWNDLATVIDGDFKAVVNAGAAIERKHHKDVAELVKVSQRTMTIGGFQVPVANLPYTLTSDAGSLMCERNTAPFAACYWDTPEGRVFSLRSRGEFDVSEVAKKYGGGGHKNASGFRVTFDKLAQFEAA